MGTGGTRNIHRIAGRYSQALFGLAQESGLSREVFEDILILRKLTAASEELRRFLQTPHISAPEREKALRKIFTGKVQRMTLNFLVLLAVKNRLRSLDEICAKYEERHLEQSGVATARVTSARPLDAQQLARITERLKTKWSKDIRLETAVDPAIIAGIKIQVGDVIQDLTVQTQFEKIRNRILTLQR